MEKRPPEHLESLDDELFASVPESELTRVAAGYIVSSGNHYEHTVVNHTVDVEYVD
jgi:hypothetical protein